jgi:hypothetical protein
VLATSRGQVTRRDKAVDVNFRFSDGVSKVFKNPGELRIHYSSQAGTGLARITLAGGPLNAK